ncbi:MAG: hypothetical protein WC716_03225 [Chitinophagaceae bacterium]|jgi:hypothetical protein
MKKVIFSVATFALVATNILTSCKKDAPIAKKLTTLEQIQLVGENYSDYPKNLAKGKEPNAGRVIAADACGALSGCMTILTSVLGACAYSVYDLYQQGSLGLVVNNPNGGTSNPNNPYDNLGVFHNQTIISYANQYGQNTGITTGSLNSFIANSYNSTFTYTPTSTETTFVNNFNFIQLHSSLVESSYNNTGISGIVENHKNAGYLDQVEANILSTYLNNLANFSTLNEGQSYSIDCENVILNSNLPSASKQKLLISMSIARNSFTLYFGKELI